MSPPPHTIETSQKIFVSAAPALKASKPIRITKPDTEFVQVLAGTKNITDGRNLRVKIA